MISNSIAPLMIVGVGRSGTSLLQSMIAAHGDFSVVPETSFFRRYVVPRTLRSSISENGTDAARSLLLSDKFLERLELDIASIFDETISASADDVDASMYIRLLRAYAEKSGLMRFADKEPRAVESLPLIHDLWPDCKILHIYRDPRDVLASKKKAVWSRSGTAFRHVVAGRIQWYMSQRFKRQVGEGTYREIKYEELLDDPARELRSVCEWLGVEYRPEMLDFSSAAAGLISDDEYSWKKETTGPLLKSNHGKWKLELSQFEAVLAEQINSDLINYGEYPKGPVRLMAKFLCFPAVVAAMAVAALYLAANRSKIGS